MCQTAHILCPLLVSGHYTQMNKPTQRHTLINLKCVFKVVNKFHKRWSPLVPSQTAVDFSCWPCIISKLLLVNTPSSFHPPTARPWKKTARAIGQWSPVFLDSALGGAAWLASLVQNNLDRLCLCSGPCDPILIKPFWGNASRRPLFWNQGSLRCCVCVHLTADRPASSCAGFSCLFVVMCLRHPSSCICVWKYVVYDSLQISHFPRGNKNTKVSLKGNSKYYIVSCHNEKLNLLLTLDCSVDIC